MLSELLASDHRQTLAFFVVGLRDVSGPAVDRQELLYNASVLAHYAETSTVTSEGFPTLANLSVLADQFVMPNEYVGDGMMEQAATQCLLLAGFFEDQMRRRHNIRWYSQLGAGFFANAARSEPSSPKARLLQTLSLEFESWRERYASLSRELRDRPYLLNLGRS